MFHEDDKELLKQHEYFMSEAINEAKLAAKNGDVPVGAVIIKDQAIISRGHNEKEAKDNAILHAEMIAIAGASRKLGWRLNDCSMYVTLEPCIMCAGAMIQARIKRLIIGAMDDKYGAVGSIINVLSIEKTNHKVEVIYDIMRRECSELLKEFFKKLRTKELWENYA